MVILRDLWVSGNVRGLGVCPEVEGGELEFGDKIVNSEMTEGKIVISYLVP